MMIRNINESTLKSVKKIYEGKDKGVLYKPCRLWRHCHWWPPESPPRQVRHSGPPLPGDIQDCQQRLKCICIFCITVQVKKLHAAFITTKSWQIFENSQRLTYVMSVIFLKTRLLLLLLNIRSACRNSSRELGGIYQIEGLTLEHAWCLAGPTFCNCNSTCLQQQHGRENSQQLYFDRG